MQEHGQWSRGRDRDEDAAVIAHGDRPKSLPLVQEEIPRAVQSLLLDEHCALCVPAEAGGKAAERFHGCAGLLR